MQNDELLWFYWRNKMLDAHWIYMTYYRKGNKSFVPKSSFLFFKASAQISLDNILKITLIYERNEKKVNKCKQTRDEEKKNKWIHKKFLSHFPTTLIHSSYFAFIKSNIFFSLSLYEICIWCEFTLAALGEPVHTFI